jgi:cellulose synthase/poly-beta-1,6-N-acetylglucosamine synthase-like glycosyltransferase
MLQIMTAFIIGTAVVNLIRMTAYLVGADVYRMRRARAGEDTSFRPAVSVVVPVHNERSVVERTLASLLGIDYAPLQIIVADDGSTDDTVARVHAWKALHDTDGRIEVFAQPNGGKADALNNAIKALATGELVMCLDGDSIIAPDAVTKSVAYFRDERVVATASNVNILPNGTLLGLVQRFEYLISYHMKKAHNTFNMEYIIGGIGSMFRRDVLDRVGLYDTNTMTEDIDLSMKIIAKVGNRRARLAYAADALTFTEAVPSFRSLIRQRYRWKYGRMQTFYKNWRLFFSTDTRHAKGLSWFFLPYALAQEALYLVEPLIVTTVIAVSIYWRTPWVLLSAMIIISVYVIANILGTAHLSWRDKALLSALAPSMYVLLYLLSVIEYIALLQAIVKLHRLAHSVSAEWVTWVSPERAGSGGVHRATVCAQRVTGMSPERAVTGGRHRATVCAQRVTGVSPERAVTGGRHRATVCAQRVTWASPERAVTGSRHRATVSATS